MFPYLVKGRTNTFSASHIAKVIQRPTYIVKEMQKDENGKVIFGKWGEEQKEFGFDILPAIGMDLSLCELSFTMDTAFINQHLPNSRALLASVVDIIKKKI